MKIINIIGKEIFDSRGFPTVACDIYLDNGSIVTSSVPSGSSRSKYEAKELRDGNKFLLGMGVQKAVNNINKIIAPQFIGKEPNAVQMDLDMIQMDGTANKSDLGANAILAVSMSMYRAHALMLDMELFNFIALVCDSETVSLPLPFINIINGGAHADNKLIIQEYLVIPFGAANARKALDASVTLFYTLKELLKENNRYTGIGLEGGFASNFESNSEPFDFIIEAINKLDSEFQIFTYGIDAAVSQYYDSKSGHYKFNDEVLTKEDLIGWYAELFENYNLFSLEDGLNEDDWEGWASLNKTFGSKMTIVGDDLFATNPERIIHGINLNAANTVIIKPNQIGTVTEALQAIQLCKEAGLNTMASHRSGETLDTFIVDLAVGANTNYIKCGGVTRGERIAKYNRYLEIENILTSSSE